jgi:hypothetical protein
MVFLCSFAVESSAGVLDGYLDLTRRVPQRQMERGWRLVFDEKLIVSHLLTLVVPLFYLSTSLSTHAVVLHLEDDDHPTRHRERRRDNSSRYSWVTVYLC